MTTELTKAAQQDITERLRKDKWHITGVDAEEAAQLIEELRAQLAKAKADERHIYEAYSRCADERSALTQRPAAQSEAQALAHNMMLWREDAVHNGNEYVPVHVRTLEKVIEQLRDMPAPQQATPEPVAKVADLFHAVRDRLVAQGADLYDPLFIRPAPGVPEGFALVPLTEKQVWQCDEIMSINARVSLRMPTLMQLVRAVEALQAKALAAAQAKGAGHE